MIINSHSRFIFWGDLYDHFIEPENLHFNYEYEFHVSSENDQEIGYGLDLDLLKISY